MIGPTDLTGVDETLARRVLLHARSIAPCLNNLPDGDDRDGAIAVLRGVAAEATARGSRQIKGQRIGSASVDYTGVDSWFSVDDKAALRSLCSVGTPGPTPIGEFPKPARVISSMWPD